MKIRILTKHGKWDCSHTGKGKLIKRLTPELEALGCEVTDNLNMDVDIELMISRFHYEPKRCKKIVIRSGPVHVDLAKNHKWLNKRKKKALKELH